MSKMPIAMRFILLPFYGTYLKLRYALITNGFEKLKGLDGPALVFSNHVHTLDPFFISARFPLHIRWVAGAYLFKMKVPSFLLRHWVYAIPKAQGKSDLETIRSISAALKNGDVVGLFPEGTRSWDGSMMNITEATAKLVRLFKVPVVFINIEGGFSKKPRWSHTERKGKVYLNCKKVLTSEEIKAMKLEDLISVVSDNLTFDNTRWQKENNIEYYDKNKQAVGIERVMYECLECHSYETLKSDKDKVICLHCGAEYAVNGYFDVVSKGSSMSLSDYRKKEIEDLRSLTSLDSKEEILAKGGSHGILLQKGEKGRNVVLSKDFILRSFPDRLVFILSNEELTFFFKDISSMIICAKYTVEFYDKGQLYRFRLRDGESTLKYFDYYNEFLDVNKDS